MNDLNKCMDKFWFSLPQQNGRSRIHSIRKRIEVKKRIKLLLPLLNFVPETKNDRKKRHYAYPICKLLTNILRRNLEYWYEFGITDKEYFKYISFLGKIRQDSNTFNWDKISRSKTYNWEKQELDNLKNSKKVIRQLIGDFHQNLKTAHYNKFPKKDYFCEYDTLKSSRYCKVHRKKYSQ